MKKILTILIAVGMVAASHAVPITGQIEFGSFTTVSLVGGGFATATGLDFADGENAIVNEGASGHFAIAEYENATFYDFDFAPLDNADPVWTVDAGGFSFALTSVSVDRLSNGIILSGWGIVSSTTSGLDDSVGSFYFSIQGNDAVSTRFSFSANSSAVPDAGSTVALLGGALGLLGFLRRRLNA